jgi:hypothetical protein
MMLSQLHRTYSINRRTAVNDEWGRMWKEAAITDFRYYPRICLDRLKKTPKTS